MLPCLMLFHLGYVLHLSPFKPGSRNKMNTTWNEPSSLFIHLYLLGDFYNNNYFVKSSIACICCCFNIYQYTLISCVPQNPSSVQQAVPDATAHLQAGSLAQVWCHHPAGHQVCAALHCQMFLCVTV